MDNQVLPWVQKYLGIKDKDEFIKMLRGISDPIEFDNITQIVSLGFPSFDLQPVQSEVNSIVMSVAGIFDF